MITLGLDLSTSTGYAVYDDDGYGNLLEFKTISLNDPLSSYGRYPFSYIIGIDKLVREISAVVKKWAPDKIIIEETNLGRNRYSQKILEFIHCSLLRKLDKMGFSKKVFYISTSSWRKQLIIKYSEQQRKSNKTLASAKRAARKKGRVLNKKELGIRGKITLKHLSIEYVNRRYNLGLQMKDNDIADAICLCDAFLAGAPLCDGK